MCLMLDVDKFESCKALIDSKGIQFYKIYGVDADCTLISPVQEEEVEITVDGFILSNRGSVTLTAEEIDNRNVNYGIHVATIQGFPSALRQIRVPLIVDSANFVGCNSSMTHAVFTKVQVDQDLVDQLTKAEIQRRVLNNEGLDFEWEEEDDWEDDDDDDDDDDWDDEDEDEEEEEEEDDDEDECEFCGDPDCWGECLDDDDEEEDDDE